jgi:hypothetical protein
MFGDAPSPHSQFWNWQDQYGFEGGDDETGETIFTGSLSMLSFKSQACGRNPAIARFVDAFPWMAEFWQVWNPVASRFWSELNHAAVFVRDTKKGERITSDYSRWNSFLTDGQRLKHGELCPEVDGDLSESDKLEPTIAE